MTKSDPTTPWWAERSHAPAPEPAPHPEPWPPSPVGLRPLHCSRSEAPSSDSVDDASPPSRGVHDTSRRNRVRVPLLLPRRRVSGRGAVMPGVMPVRTGVNSGDPSTSPAPLNNATCWSRRASNTVTTPSSFDAVHSSASNRGCMQHCALANGVPQYTRVRAHTHTHIHTQRTEFVD